MKKTILYADDDTSMLSLGEFFMEDDEFEVVTATNTREAEEMLASLDALAVVIADLHMPEEGVDDSKDGIELLEVICKTRPDVLRVLLSGDVEPEVAARATGVCHLHVTKPVDFGDLFDKIRELLDDDSSHTETSRE